MSETKDINDYDLWYSVNELTEYHKSI